MSDDSGRVDAINRRGTMSAVTFGEAHAKAGLPFTVEELDRLPNYPAQAEVSVLELRDGRYSTAAVTTARLTVPT